MPSIRLAIRRIARTLLWSRQRPWALAMALVGSSIWLATPGVAADNDELRRLHDLVSNWQIVEARERLGPLIEAEPDSATARLVLARVLFFEGNYGGATRVFDAIAEQWTLPPDVAELRAHIEKTAQALKDFDEFVTEDRRFLIRYKGRDRLLLPYIVPVLQRQDDALAADFGFRPADQIIVEIYPDLSYLAAVSPLTMKDLETSGTIALCKYNRLMFTSPRALVKGYPWRDTVAHELVHYYVTKRSRNTVPIWLHEGIAKFQESRWRREPGAILDPQQEDLLARSIKQDQLVTLEQMHPSMAFLPSQEAAALAFAEVHTIVDHLFRANGFTKINVLLDRLEAGESMNRALGKAYGTSLDGLWRAWKADMKGRGLKTYPGLVQTSLKFKRPGQSDSEGDSIDADYDTIEQKQTKDFAHLAELLRARDRHNAALKEYRKAIALGGDGNPMVQNGAARSLLDLGAHGEVPGTLARVRRYYPGYLSTFVNLGDAYLELEETDAAIEAFETAVGINPFHPRVHQALAQLYAKVGRTDDAAQAQKALEILQ